jgi:hypothetical protein
VIDLHINTPNSLFMYRHVEGKTWWHFTGSARRQNQQIKDTNISVDIVENKTVFFKYICLLQSAVEDVSSPIFIKLDTKFNE